MGEAAVFVELRRLPEPILSLTAGGIWHQCTVLQVIPQPSLEEQRALVASLATVRLRRFRSSVGGAERAAVELYLLDAQVASHLHATLRFVEIALRESIHRALSGTYGDRWFQSRRDLFDESFCDDIDDAVAKVGDRAPAGKVVAQLMLGTWVDLLGRGDRKPDGTKATYAADLWQAALEPALPTTSTRPKVHRLALRLNWARNRINHCEPVIFGFPQPGIGQGGVQVRRTPHLILEDARELVEHLDPALAAWLRRWREIDTLLSDPLVAKALDHVATDAAVNLQR
ncbi:hypothetical protein ACF049_19055 [Cellulosimicrobium funkei]|uniref:hypothetical protein n=1 Tax=Cellulosimicrobium TaxID=157920 RepID=UPI000FE143DB|nr:hypothetical protein [Cellulosimicrobium sp. MM]UTT61280.1 hypothetical protein NMQ07_19400 [Cellulosimicrobium cellulans]